MSQIIWFLCLLIFGYVAGGTFRNRDYELFIPQVIAVILLITWKNLS